MQLFVVFCEEMFVNWVVNAKTVDNLFLFLYFEISIWNNQVSGKFDRIVFLIGLLEGKEEVVA